MLLTIIGVTVLQQFANPSLEAEAHTKSASRLQHLLQDTINQHQTLTVQLVQDGLHQCVVDEILQNLQIPIILRSHRGAADVLTPVAGKFNNQLLSVVCLHGTGNEVAIKSLAISLELLRLTPIIFILPPQYKPREMLQLLLQCNQYDMLNYIVIRADFEHDSRYYYHRVFPQHDLPLKQYIPEELLLFPLSVPFNVQERQIAVAADWSEPHSFVYNTSADWEHYSGYLVTMARAFAQHVNGSLRFPYGSKRMYMREMFRLTRNRSIDISICLSDSKLEMNLYEYAYPIEIAKWFTVLPVEKQIAKGDIFVNIFQDPWYKLLTIINWILMLIAFRLIRGPVTFIRLCVDVLAGILGKPVAMPPDSSRKLKLLYVVLFVTGFTTVNIYLTYFNALLVNLPSLPRIETFDDLLAANMKIAMYTEELKLIQEHRGPSFWSKYGGCFLSISSYDDFAELRRSFNSHYGYTVTSSLWPVFEERQKYYARRIFRPAYSLVHDEFGLTSLGLQNNSIFKRDLDAYIMRLHEYGILTKWFRDSIWEMVASKRIPMRDFSTEKRLLFLQCQDLYRVWVTYLCMTAASMVAFVLELLYFRWTKSRQ